MKRSPSIAGQPVPAGSAGQAAAADRVPRPPHRSGAPPLLIGLPAAAGLDLTREDEATREAIRRLAVAHFWTPAAGGAAPDYTPQEAGLAVHLFCGRWFVSFRELEDADADYLPEVEKCNLSRVLLDPAAPLGVAFRRC